MTDKKELKDDERIKELIEEAKDNCRCMLPEQSCPYCRLIAKLNKKGEIPYR